jgi:purine-binding chemotaxis protein CheW
MIEQLTAEPVTRLHCTFWLQQRWFGVPADLVREVHAPAGITPIPGAPRSVAGYVNLRGQLFLVLDAGSLLTGITGKQPPGGHLIVFKSTAGEAFAIQAGEVGDIVAVHPDQVDVPKTYVVDGAASDETAREPASIVVGHARLDRALLILIDPKRLLTAAMAEATP